MGDECCRTCGLFAGKEPPPPAEDQRPLAGARFKIRVSGHGSNFEYVPDKPIVTIGRVAGNDVELRSGTVSRRASQIHFRDDAVVVEDLKSTCGTYVNGRKIAGPTKLGSNAKIYIGDFILEVLEA
jgi:pilus assembly protein CpaF